MKQLHNTEANLVTAKPRDDEKRLPALFGMKAVALVIFVLIGISADAGLVHRYNFTSNANDSVGTANGTLGNGTISGGKLITDGTKTGVTLPAAAVAGITGPFAIEAWYYATAPQGAYHTAFSFSDGTQTQYLLAQPNRDSGQSWNSGISVLGGGGTVGQKLMMGFPGDVFPDNPDQTPRQVLVTYDGTNFIYYWNGIQASIAPTATDPGFSLQSLAAKIGINSGSPFNDPSLNGYTTDFRIYNQNLTAEQAVMLYARGPDASNADIASTLNPAYANRFTNPLMQGQDPEVEFKDGIFNLVQSDGCNIRLRQSTTLGGLITATAQIILSPGCVNLWAPEIHWFNNRWYLYYTLESGHGLRVYVAESQGTSPAGPYTIRGILMDGYWNIDGGVFAATNGQLYFVYSGIPASQQYICIAPMSNPYTLSGPSVTISTPDQPWELNGTVNEGPFGFTRNGKTFIVYSASGCWTDDYCLGLLTLSGTNLLDSNAWTKAGPVFTKQSGAFGPGHNGVFTDANGQWWNIYHANNLTGQGCGGYRQIRIQRLAWDANNMPVFGAPVPIGSWVSGDTNFLAAQFPLTETNGSIASNASYSRAGNLVGAPIWMNPGLKFNGTNDYVECSATTGNDVQTALTLSAWVRPERFNDWASIFTKGTNTAPYAMQLWGDGSLRFTANFGSPGGAVGGGSWNSTAKLVANQWQHVAVTYDGTTVRFYLNGVLDVNQPTAALHFGVADEPLTIGVDLPGGDEYFKGTIRDARVYGRALSGSEIQAIQNEPPVLATVSNAVIVAGQNLVIANSATDPNVPPQTLTYSLLAAPSGANLNPASGYFTWRPTLAQSPSTNLITLRVADNGSPSISATQSFTVKVLKPQSPALSSAIVNNGIFSMLIGGDAGPDYILEANTNLVNTSGWLPTATNYSATPPYLWSDPQPVGPNQKFYRVRLAP